MWMGSQGVHYYHLSALGARLASYPMIISSCLLKNESCQAYVTEKYQNLTVTNDRNEPKASGCGRGTQMVPVDHWGTIEE